MDEYQDTESQVIRPKSKTVGLFERRAQQNVTLQKLESLQKKQISLEQMNAHASSDNSISTLESSANQTDLSIDTSVSLVLAKEVDEKNKIFSPHHYSIKGVKLLQETSRQRLNTGGNLSSNQNQNCQQKIQKLHVGTFQRLYKLGKKIGEGAHSVVRECSKRQRDQEDSPSLTSSIQRELVVKILKYHDTEYLFSEEKIMNEFRNHPQLITKVDFLLEKNRKTAYLVMEKANGLNLTQILQQSTQLSESESQLIIKQVLQAVKFLHDKNICHRDITNNNIIYDQEAGKVKLIDFSVSKQLRKSNEMLWTSTGSIGFMAPEIFTDTTYDKQVDMWSVGVVVHSLLTGYLPFYEPWQNKKQLIKSIIDGKLFLHEVGSHLSQWCIDFLHKCLEKDPLKRLTPTEALAHPWMNKVEAQELSYSNTRRNRKGLIVLSMNDIDDSEITPFLHRKHFDFEYLYLDRFNANSDASKFLRYSQNLN